jgi:integrase
MADLLYYIKKPNKPGRSYVLVCYTPITRTKKTYHELSDKLKADVANVNKQFLSKTIEPHEAEALLKEIIQSQYRKGDVQRMVLKNSVLSEANQKLFQKFWAEKYETRYLEDIDSPRYDFLKALKSIEPLAVSAATQAQLQGALKKSGLNNDQIRRATNRLNEILNYLKRDVRLQKPKEQLKSVRHLSRDEFDKLSQKFGDPVCRDLAMTLFCSGLRFSEALALTPEDFNGFELQVNKQLSKDGTTLKLPKRGKQGRVVVFNFGIKELERWLQVKDKNQYRWTFQAALEDACRAAFPDTRGKWITPHDLRHSHAIYLLNKGATLKQVALNLRNRQDVCEKYYIGYAHSEGTLDALKLILKKDS